MEDQRPRKRLEDQRPGIRLEDQSPGSKTEDLGLERESSHQRPDESIVSQDLVDPGVDLGIGVAFGAAMSLRKWVGAGRGKKFIVLEKMQ